MPDGGHDPAVPTGEAAVSWSLAQAAQLALVGLFLLAIAVLAAITKPVVVPIIAAIVIGMILMPIISGAEKRGVPRTVSAISLTMFLAGVAAAAVAVLAMPISQWVSRASEFGSLLRERLSGIDRPISAIQRLLSSMHELTGGPKPVVAVDTSQTNLVETVLGVVTPALGQFLLFLGALVFFLIYHASIKRGIVLFFTNRDVRLKALHILGDVERQMSVYFATVALINMALGVVTALVAWGAGLANPVLWGLLAAVLNFIPYVGPAVVTATLLLAGLLTFPTLGPALVAPGLFVLITSIEGHFLSPGIIGRRLTMNPFLVFLGIGFWTWLWGPIGAFLAVPIVLAMVVVARHLVPDDKPDLPA
jgi:predicted PurR-regulated permease PerM